MTKIALSTRLAHTRNIVYTRVVEYKPYSNQPRNTVEDLLIEARAKLPNRLTPAEASNEMSYGAKLIDIRYLEQRISGGDIPGAILVHRNEFEWRCDPSSPWRDERIEPNDYGQRLIIICNQGYQSSLAAAVLQGYGMEKVTDVEGGFENWKATNQPWVPFVKI